METADEFGDLSFHKKKSFLECPGTSLIQVSERASASLLLRKLKKASTHHLHCNNISVTPHAFDQELYLLLHLENFGRLSRSKIIDRAARKLHTYQPVDIWCIANIRLCFR